RLASDTRAQRRVVGDTRLDGPVDPLRLARGPRDACVSAAASWCDSKAACSQGLIPDPSRRAVGAPWFDRTRLGAVAPEATPEACSLSVRSAYSCCAACCSPAARRAA